MRFFVFLGGLFFVFFSATANAYVDEYNNYNNANSTNNTSSSNPSANSPQGLQTALNVFQNVDCQHMGCDTKKQDFFDQSGSADAPKNFKIIPSASSANSDSDSSSDSNADSGAGADLVGT